MLLRFAWPWWRNSRLVATALAREATFRLEEVPTMRGSPDGDRETVSDLRCVAGFQGSACWLQESVAVP